MDQATFRAYTAHAGEIARRHASSRRVVAGIAQYFTRAFDPGDRILDVGAGAGGDLAWLVSEGYQAYGMEPVAEMRAEAIRAHPELRERLVEGSLPDALPDLASIGGRVLASIPTLRTDIDEAGRDPFGRLFSGVQAGELDLLFQRAGFRNLERWGEEDSLGRGGVVRWATLLLELADDGRAESSA